MRSFPSIDGLALAYAVLGTALLYVYGTQVCPFIESLTPAWFLAELGTVLAAALLARAPLDGRLVAPLESYRRPFRSLQVDLSLFLACGLFLTLFNRIVHDFPVGSGIRLLLGFVTLGLFASLDLALARQRREFESGDGSDFPLTLGLSVTRQLLVAFVCTMIFSAGILFLSITKDVDWLLTNPAGDVRELRMSVVLDVLFTLTVIMGFGIRVLVSYSRNLKRLFEVELEILARVEAGQLDSTVPVLTRDEFGVIASRTNQMIVGLRERDKVKATLGKVVSPRIAEQLLTLEPGVLRAGQRRDLIILFCDLRDFTSFTESTTAEEVVRTLNEYFTEVCAVIDRRGGLVDKFIGDAVLAVFGFENGSEATEDAFQAALEIVAIADGPDRPFRNGIGLHAGSVIAGALGSPDRFEFTVIGDAVNVASRLEGLCKSLGHRILLSRETRDLLTEESRRLLVPLGPQALKGKKEALEVFGAVCVPDTITHSPASQAGSPVIRCSSCEARFTIPVDLAAQLAGKKVKCRKCQHPIQLPDGVG